MGKIPIVFEKERGFSEVLNVTFQFVGQEFKSFFKSILIFAGIPMILLGLGFYFYFLESARVATYQFNEVFSTLTPLAFMVIIALLLLISINVLMVSTIYNYMVLYKEKGSGGFNNLDIWERNKAVFFKIFWAGFLMYLIIFLGFLFFIIPGVYLTIPFSILFAVVIVEKRGFSSGWDRCFFLVRNNWWRTFGVFFIMSFIIISVGMAFNLLEVILMGLGGLFGSGEGLEVISVPLLAGISVVRMVFHFFFQTLIYLALGFQFYSLAEQKDKNTLLDRINKISGGE